MLRSATARPPSCNFIKKETPTQVFSVNFAKKIKNTFFPENLRVTASVCSEKKLFLATF